MYRASLRSVPDPLRGHVCLSCLARGSGAQPRARRFHTSPWLRSQTTESPPLPIEEQLKALEKHLPDRNKPARSKNANPAQEAKKAARKAAKQEASRLRKDEPAKQEVNDKTTPEPTQPKDKKKPRGQQQQQQPKQQPNAETDAAKEKPLPPKAEFAAPITKKDIGKVNADRQSIKALDVETPEVPRLSFGLDRVLFNPGVYQLRDPRSRVYNFDPYLGSIMPVTEFDFEALKEYITSSKDDLLRGLARKEKKKYIGSSSSMTSVLSHFHYLLSSWREVSTLSMSRSFQDRLRTFTRLLRAPSAMFLRYQDGVYAIDADKEHDTANILMNLGKSMEKLLTLPKEDFERYRRSSANKISAEEEQAVPEAYHYSTYGDFLMRSQLDAYDPRLPGTGMFDLKTRAVASIRMDAKNFEHGLGYEIRKLQGTYESYEREYYDMIRAALLKYSLQVRIGRMDGIFVAFHNIERIFGFQYISLPELDMALHGQYDTALGDREFLLSLQLWNKVLDKATARFPKQSLRFHFETRDAAVTQPYMYIFVEPVTEEEIHAIQTTNQAEIDAYQRRVLDLPSYNENNDLNDAEGIPADFDSPNPAEESAADASTPETEGETSPTSPGKEMMGFALTIRNIVDGECVERPTQFQTPNKWTVDYELNHLAPNKVPQLYSSCQHRRKIALNGRGEDETEVAANVYIRRLRELAKKGRKYRKEQNKLDEQSESVVLRD
ncbi:mitochondrial mRNA processing protein PET127 [Aspergillus sclerotiicarbonarius CBS 121057]|uniref:Mitochondrial mRNA processing protein PET127 n=1 Tax=Aspergillus sclerotiicarbonarius (strain CBS 121057 / IBT 28362) TaxID=1448318 RepID=A0A319ETU0_ASPSB|nr:mitochondrial mRNA processing protein PET127 [Aspergillus sclerotiicarbonarius CBS 121057]